MRIAIRIVIAALGACLAAAASAQSYPVKPVRVIIPWPPGGSNDIVGRIVAQKLSEMSGQQFVETKHLSEPERAMLMGGTCAKAYGWSPKNA